MEPGRWLWCTRVQKMMHQKGHCWPRCWLLEEAASEHKPSPGHPSPHLKFQINEHFTQKGKFSTLTHKIIIFCL